MLDIDFMCLFRCLPGLLAACFTSPIAANYLTPLGPLSEANLFLALVVLNPSPLSLSHSHTHLEFGAPSVTSALGENPDLGRGIWHPENLSKGKMTQS